jgi:hypothetical protein
MHAIAASASKPSASPSPELSRTASSPIQRAVLGAASVARRTAVVVSDGAASAGQIIPDRHVGAAQRPVAGAPVNRGKGCVFLNVSFALVVVRFVFIVVSPLPGKAAICFKKSAPPSKVDGIQGNNGRKSVDGLTRSQRGQFGLRTAAINYFDSQLPAFGNGARATGDEQRCAGVEQHRVALWPAFVAAQNAMDD